MFTVVCTRARRELDPTSQTRNNAPRGGRNQCVSANNANNANMANNTNYVNNVNNANNTNNVNNVNNVNNANM